MLEIDELFVVGKEYKVNLKDCCVTGDFISTVTLVDKEEDFVAFTNGVRLECAVWGQGVTAEEVVR